MLTHLNRYGKAKMVDVGAKPETPREAIAVGEIGISSKILRLLKLERIPKGDVLSVSRVAAIMAAKKTHELIPLCHPLKLDAVEIDFKLGSDRIGVRARVTCTGKTGVEMEALTAATIAALTIYDMCKSQDKGMTIGPIFLVKKSGGKSGQYKSKRKSPWL